MRTYHVSSLIFLVLALAAAKDYSLHTELISWDVAFELCRFEGGYLTVMNSLYDAEMVNALFDTITDPEVDFISVGISDQAKEGEWRTVTGGLVSYSGYDNFAVGEPVNVTGFEDCGVMDRNMTYHSVECADPKFPYICDVNVSNSTLW